jgi:hypothetical protein
LQNLILVCGEIGTEVRAGVWQSLPKVVPALDRRHAATGIHLCIVV